LGNCGVGAKTCDLVSSAYSEKSIQHLIDTQTSRRTTTQSRIKMENGTTQGEGKDPSGFLSDIIGSQVTVKLNSGVVYKGKPSLPYVKLEPILTRGIGELQSVDGYMNIALEKTEEHVDGVKKRSYGDAFVRGNNGKEYIILGSKHSLRFFSDVHLCGLRGEHVRLISMGSYGIFSIWEGVRNRSPDEYLRVEMRTQPAYKPEINTKPIQSHVTDGGSESKSSTRIY
jgi:U6 snRNA-associated Sm-like protein LSm6